MLDTAQLTDIERSHSPIIEDPRERDSRPPSTDPIEDRKIGISPNPMDNSTSTPSGSVSPALESSRIDSVATMQTDDTPDTGASDTKTSLNAQQSSSSSHQTTHEPIFRPLITEKGKSKTTGKSIGGWI